MFKRSNILFLFFLFSIQYSIAQDSSLITRNDLRKLIAEDKLEKAQTELDKNIAYYKAQKNYDSLVNYFEFAGSFILAKGNKALAISRSNALNQFFQEQKDPFLTAKGIVGHGGIIYEAGEVKDAYDLLLTALKFVPSSGEKKEYIKYEIEYDLGYYSQNLSDYPNAKKHYINAIRALEKYSEPDYISSQRTYNAIAGIYWALGKMDSTQYYFQKSLDALEKAPDEGDFMNEYYRPALLQMNMAVVAQALGKSNDAISSTENAVKLFQKFLDNSLDEQRTLGARKNQLAAIDNLGVFYSERGEFTRAEELITYSYNLKKKFLEDDDGNIILSKIILAQSKVNTKDLEGAAALLDEAISQIEDEGDILILWKALAYTTRGSVYKEMGDFENASVFFEKGEQIQKQALNGNYSKEFLEDLGAMAVFYAEIGDKDKAIAKATEAYTSTKKGDFKNTLREFKSTTILAQVYYILGEYEKAKEYSNAALNFTYSSENQVNKVTDSILLQFEKPTALAINIGAVYKLESNKSKDFLIQLLNKVEEGVAILDQRKTILKTHSDLTSLITQNQELFNLAKKIRLELYRLTKNQQYLDDIIELHESSLYNRIRSRLNFRQDIAFSGVPTDILEREIALKNSIASALEGNSDAGINTFFKATKTWNTFLDSLQHSYPDYYKMRYASIKEPLDDLQAKIPTNTTVVRYLFIEKELYAIIITTSEKKMVPLPFKEDDQLIARLDQAIFNEKESGNLSYVLYEQLWKPFENEIKTKNIIVIPDGALFNLSFETLTPIKSTSFKEITKNGLLSKYVISYNYSLLLLNSKTNTTVFNKNLIAFAPEFTGTMKQDYKLSITDSIETDNTYLTLLPQPFSADLAKKSSKLYDGKAFLNTNSTETVFKNNAAEHKIIHIGTHAESNNINPELSRLIFAKSNDDWEDNSLYTYEIYNTNLSSNLAILTACETGKPSYQPGEGMISLAHAFNYAGSESMLTSLWKIDEQSSTQIIEYFYAELAKGLPKDEALKNAKLRYIETAQGRTLSPQYWAGLVLIGDTTPINLAKNQSVWLWVFVSVVLLLLLFFFLRKKSAT
ncbi:CHAT domain-containing protein [Jejudonia soesokkakensis]|uniref:CHAT domain-containing protein n=1 Tax=Jejudonia soesokkakensis TaxID=1323432 RepID=A0ABW2MSX7_9FLAO